MNKKQKIITFTTETENMVYFFNFKICKQKGKFTKVVFKKDEFIGLYIDFSSFRALKNKLP